MAVEREQSHTWSNAIRLNACSRLETITVNTRSSVYEVIVLRGDRGDVLVRGGRLLPEFRYMKFVGSTAGGSALRPNTIDVGLRMSFASGRTSY